MATRPPTTANTQRSVIVVQAANVALSSLLLCGVQREFQGILFLYAMTTVYAWTYSRIAGNIPNDLMGKYNLTFVCPIVLCVMGTSFLYPLVFLAYGVFGLYAGLRHEYQTLGAMERDLLRAFFK